MSIYSKEKNEIVIKLSPKPTKYHINFTSDCKTAKNMDYSAWLCERSSIPGIKASTTVKFFLQFTEGQTQHNSQQMHTV